MKRSWTRRTVVVAVASSLIGFWLPDGVRLVVLIFGDADPVDPAVRLMSTVVTVAFGLVVEQAYMTQSLLTSAPTSCPDEWTRDWCDFLRSTRSSGRRVEYVVMATADELAQADAKLASMRRFLDDCDAQLLTCDRALVVDSLGAFSCELNIEVFDDSVLKTQALLTSPAGYRGGIELTMSVMRADDRPDLLTLAHTVRRCAEVYGG